MSKKVLVIIPLHKKDDRVFRAIASVPKEWKVVVSSPNDGISKMITGDPDHFVRNCISEKGESDYQTLVNNVLNKIGTFYDEEFDYITILEYDDCFTPNAKKVVEEYSEDEVEILTPLACVVKEGEDKPILIGISNEASFAGGISENFGYIDFNMMLRSNFMFVNGCFIKPNVFKEYGVFKSNFKAFHDYEWALRMVYNGVIIKAVPRATHIHYLYDDGMFADQKNLNPELGKKWLAAARREYFFSEDRELNIS